MSSGGTCFLIFYEPAFLQLDRMSAPENQV